MPFLEIRTPRDMFEKAKREHARLKASFDIDHVFNFFVTAYHIRDYVENAAPNLLTDLKLFCTDQDIRDCRDLCDKAKHMTLTYRADPQTHQHSGAIGGAPIGAVPIGGQGQWELRSSGRTVNIEAFGG